MRINDTIYFSPSLRLADLDLSNKEQLLEYFAERIKAYYLEPVRELVKSKMAFRRRYRIFIDRRFFKIFKHE